MRFVADENVSRLVIERLRTGGFDVTSIAETRSAASDKEVLEMATAEDCILITEGNLLVIEPGRIRIRPLPQ